MPDNPDTVARGGNIAERVEAHADAILRAAGSGLRHYTMPSTRRAILAAVRAAMLEECER